MLTICETKNNEDYIQLENKDYIIITNNTKKISLIVTNLGGKLHIDNYKWKKSKIKKEK